MNLRRIRLSRTTIIFIYLLIIFFIFIFKVMKKSNYSSERFDNWLKILTKIDHRETTESYVFQQKDISTQSATYTLGYDPINIIDSNKISFKRKLMDVRDPLCKNVEHGVLLPTASVIIVFYNEPQSAIMRTVHSIMDETPPRYLEEIILIDDYSDEEELKNPLDEYITQKFPQKLKLIRLKRREGLIKSRLKGATIATGDVLVFLEAHCEVVKGWLPPLLQRIKDKNNIAVMPVIDIISESSLEYKLSAKPGSFLIGGFSWWGNFKWIRASERNLSSRTSPISPIMTPTAFGGIFAIDRKYFSEIGSYDIRMTGWEGESLEMSFRIWQCGGSLEVIPCSRVGHSFIKFFSRSFPNREDAFLINAARLAHVWMDDYKRFFFSYYKEYERNFMLIGDFTERAKLRKKLKCKSFEWYLQNIYPEKFIPDQYVDAYGKVSTRNGTLCLDSLFYNEMDPYYINVNKCDANIVPGAQNFSLSKDGFLIKEEKCAIVDENFKVVMDICKINDTKNLEWELSKNAAIVHLETGLCLDSSDLNSWQEVRVAECTGQDSQIWKFDNYSNDTNRGYD